MMALIVFLVVIGAVAIAVTWTGYRTQLEAEQTIRQAIEKGVLMDAELIVRLKRPSGLACAQRLILFGFVSLFLGAGVAAFAFILGQQEPESIAPLLAIAAFVGFLGAGLLAAGWWLRRDTANS